MSGSHVRPSELSSPGWADRAAATPVSPGLVLAQQDQVIPGPEMMVFSFERVKKPELLNPRGRHFLIANLHVCRRLRAMHGYGAALILNGMHSMDGPEPALNPRSIPCAITFRSSETVCAGTSTIT